MKTLLVSMSLRTVKKIKDMSQKEEDETKIKENIEILQDIKPKQKFFMLNDDDNDEEEEEKEDEDTEKETQENNSQKINKISSNEKKPSNNKKKKKNIKNNKSKNIKENAVEKKNEIFPDNLKEKIKESEEEKKMGGEEIEIAYCLDIKLNLLNYNKELQRYFKNAKISGGTDNGSLSKKESKQMKMLKNRQYKAHKTYYLSYGNKPLGSIPEKFICDKISTDEFGNVVFAFSPSPKYITLQAYYYLNNK